ncbi:MAG TPA: PqqD family protein [Kofleriaceae bacterium]|nr:PqqD family protein [Kofleriaceae bacterium]
MSRLRLRADCTIRPLPDGDAVVAAGEGATAVIVNQSAHAILEILADGGSEEEIAGLLCERFPGQDAAAVRRDVGALLSELERAGILEPCGAASSTA